MSSSYLGVAVYHGGVFDRRMRVAELIFRSLISIAALIAALLLVTDTQVKQIFTIQKKAKFTDMKSLLILVVVNGITAAYSTMQTFRCVVSMLRGSPTTTTSVLFNKPLAWLIFSADQVMAYLMVGATGAAAQSAAFAKLGEPQLQWMKVCDMYHKFCTQVGEAIAASLFASLTTIIISLISSFSLFRLYAPKY